MPQRPDQFTLNPHASLYKGMLFGNFGAASGGNQYRSSSPFGIHGTLTGMDPATDYLWDSVLNRRIISLDGSNDRIILRQWSSWPNTSDIFKPNPFTFNAWCYEDSAADLSKIIDYDDDAYGWQIFRSSGAYLGAIAGTTVGYGITLSATVPTHICLTYDGAVARIYGNGVQSGVDVTKALSYSNYHVLFQIGNRGTESRYWAGRIADPMIHNRQLSTAEIQQCADRSNAMLSGLINPPRRKWWPVVAGGTPATFLAAWAHKRRQTIGGGVI